MNFRPRGFCPCQKGPRQQPGKVEVAARCIPMHSTLWQNSGGEVPTCIAPGNGSAGTQAPCSQPGGHWHADRVQVLQGLCGSLPADPGRAEEILPSADRGKLHTPSEVLPTHLPLLGHISFLLLLPLWLNPAWLGCYSFNKHRARDQMSKRQAMLEKRLRCSVPYCRTCVSLPQSCLSNECCTDSITRFSLRPQDPHK